MSNNDHDNNNDDDHDNDNDTNLESDDIGELFLNRWVDCQDSYHKWYEAQIIDSDNTNSNRFKFHYKGWNAKFDDWVDISKEPERVRVLHTFTPQGNKYGDVELRKGIKCDVLDSQDKWYEAQVIEHDLVHNYVKFHYTAWSSKFDEWINCDSYRIAPWNTKAKKQQNNNNNKNNTQSKQTQNNTRINQTNQSVRIVSNNNINNNNSTRVTRRRDGGTTTNNNTNSSSSGTIVKKKPNTRGNINTMATNMTNITNNNNNNSIPVAVASVNNNTEDENDQKNGFKNNNDQDNNLTKEEKLKKQEHAKIRLQYIQNFKPTRRQEVS